MDRRSVILLVTAASLFLFQGAFADLYTWIDDQGIRHFSNIAPPDNQRAIASPEDRIVIPKGFSCRVVKVYDGDTLKVKTKELSFKVRLAGIDAPESGRKGVPGQPFSEQAKEFLIRLAFNKQVVLRQHGTGSYNRVLAEVFSGGVNLNLSLVAAGMAEVYRGRLPASLDTRAFLRAQARARKKGTGIWSLGETYQSPKAWRKRFAKPFSSKR